MGLTITPAGVVTGGQFNGASFGQAATSLGQEGWELVLSFPVADNKIEMIFKRPI
jgi:hypothetical protein